MGLGLAESPGLRRPSQDYLLKFLLVGDADVGKDEILQLVEDSSAAHRPHPCRSFFAYYSQPYHHAAVVHPREANILLEGKHVKLQLWDTCGQGRFGTIIRSYSRGAQGIVLVYDITNRWSFDGIDRWLRECDELAPGIPKVLLGNRLHFEFKRQVSREEAETYARKRKMEYFEVSTLAAFNIHESLTELSRLVLSRNGMERLWKGSRGSPLGQVSTLAAFNIHESLTELSRLVLSRNGMERLWKGSRVSSLQEAACRAIVRRLRTVHDIQRLPLPPGLQRQLSSFADSGQLTAAALSLPRGGRHRRTASTTSNSCLSGPITPAQRRLNSLQHRLARSHCALM